MSINSLLSDEQKRNEFTSGVSDVFRTTLGLTGIAAVIRNGMSNESDKALRKGKKGQVSTRLGEAGIQLEASINSAFDARLKTELRSSKQFFDGLISEASGILSRTVGTESLEDEKIARARRSIHREKTYLLTAVKDAIFEYGFGAEEGRTNQIIDLIDNLLEGDLSDTSAVSADVDNALRSIASNIPGDQRIAQMKRFQALRENSRYFSGKQKARQLADSITKTSVKMKRFGSIEELIQASEMSLKSPGFDASDLNTPNHYNNLRERSRIFAEQIRHQGGRITGYTQIQEHQNRFPSVYFNIADRSGKVRIDTIPLYASSVEGKRKILRTTSSMGTPYSGTQMLLESDVEKLLGGVTEKEAMGIISGATPERFIQTYALRMMDTSGGMSNLSTRNINQFQEFLRAQAITANKDTLRLAGDKSGGLSSGLRSAIQLQQTINSNQAIMSVPSTFTKKEAQSIPIRLMTMYPGLFDAP